MTKLDAALNNRHRPASEAELNRSLATSTAHGEYSLLTVESYREPYYRLDALNDRLRDREARRSMLNEAYTRSIEDSDALGRERRQRVAQALADGRPVPQEDRDGTHQSIEAELLAVTAEIREIRDAIRIVERREADARTVASKVICDKVRPAYRAAVAKMAEAFVAALAAADEEEAIRSGLNDERVLFATFLPVLSFTRRHAIELWLSEYHAAKATGAL
jgi:hypothetical protein